MQSEFPNLRLPTHSTTPCVYVFGAAGVSRKYNIVNLTVTFQDNSAIIVPAVASVQYQMVVNVRQRCSGEGSKRAVLSMPILLVTSKMIRI